MPAQCLVIESDVEEKSGHITATVLVKRGTLKIEDQFVSGIHEGRVKLMMNDKGAQVKKAYPGEAIHMVGFSQFPDVGNPLYVVKNREEAKFIIDRIKHREEAQKHKAMAESGEGHLAHDLKKSIGKLTR